MVVCLRLKNDFQVPGSRFGAPVERSTLWLYEDGGEFSYEMRWNKIIFTTYFLHFFAVNRGELFIFTAFSVFLQKRCFLTRVRTSYLLHAFNFLIHCNNWYALIWFFCEFKSNSVNVGKKIWRKLWRWVFVRIAVKSGEIFFSPQSQHFFERFTAFAAFLTKIHRNHSISYKDSPHSPYFLQKNSPKNLDPGNEFM